MSKKIMCEAQDDAMEASVAANESNTTDAHAKAASLQRIAAEHSSLAGDKVASDKHKALASEHDACAARCDAAAKNKVNISDEDSAKIEARKAAKVAPKVEAKDFTSRVNELSAKRMATKQPLMAALAGAGYSLNDLQTSVRNAVAAVPALNTPATGTGGEKNCVPCGGPWVCDVVCPEHEAGETWQAIVNGADGKLYAVNFTIEDGGDVSVVGEPKEVERVTDYDYVADMETEAKSAVEKEALEAGGPGSGPRPAGSVKADAASDKAADASRQSHKDGTTESAAKAADAHDAAAKSHREAAANETGDRKSYHLNMASEHDVRSQFQRAAALKQVAAKEAAPVAELSLTAKVHAVHDSLRASNPSLADVRSAMFREHRISMTDSDVAHELATKLEETK